MIKSKPNLFYLTFLFSSLVLAVSGTFNSDISETTYFILLAFAVPVISVVSLQLIHDVKQIVITEREIQIKNLVTGRTISYNLMDFDFRIEHKNWGRGGRYRVTALTINKRIVLMFSDYAYANFESLTWGLRAVPQLNYPKIGVIRWLLFLFGAQPKVEVNEVM